MALCFQKLMSQIKPEVDWGPVMVKHRVKVVHLKSFDIDPHWIGTEEDMPKKRDPYQASS